MRARPLFVLLLAGLALGVSAGFAAGESALGPEGDLYQVRAGPYGDLFPSGREAAADDPVLALDVQRAGVAPERYLVPQTAGHDPDSDASLLVEESTGTTFVLWQSRISGIFPILNLASFNGKAWSSVIEVTGNPYAPKSGAQLLVSRDVFGVAEADNSITLHHRTVIHLVWSEENYRGTYDTYYTSLILEDGVYLGRNKVYRLRAFDQAQPLAAEVALALLKAPRLQEGTDGHSVVVAFADAESGRLAVAEIRVLPRDLTALGDGARAHILGSRDRSPRDYQALAGGARAHILGVHSSLQADLVAAIGDRLRDFILSLAASGLSDEALADAVRGHILEVGARLTGPAQRSLGAPEGAQPPVLDELAAGSGPSHLLQLRIASSRPAPNVGTEIVALFASPDGDDVIAAWAFPQRVRYRESTASGWSDVREIRLTSEVSLDAAWKMLADRARSR